MQWLSDKVSRLMEGILNLRDPWCHLAGWALMFVLYIFFVVVVLLVLGLFI